MSAHAGAAGGPGNDGRAARRFLVRGTVQGVGFRPYVFRLARQHGLAGWVRNGPAGVDIHAEGAPAALRAFSGDLTRCAPPAASISAIEILEIGPSGAGAFEIEQSDGGTELTARIPPDLPSCDACLGDLFNPADRRYGYPYVNCTECGPRYSIVERLPYDRACTSMAAWTMCRGCRGEFDDPADRRFHAQPMACPDCGPHYSLEGAGEPPPRDAAALAAAASLLRDGSIVAVKGLGGYHLACDARNPGAVDALRHRKFRKERPFAVMARDLAAASAVADLSPDEVALLQSTARPIVLARARLVLEGVAPDNTELGVMLPYAPVHWMLFACGAPDVLVMTSGNRSSEPMACDDRDARSRLGGIADAWLVGERPIARRVDDSVVRHTRLGPMVLRRARGLAPGVVAELPSDATVLAVGADLKSTLTLVVGGQAVLSQYIGDLEQASCVSAFDKAVRDLTAMYQIDSASLVVAHDAHPQYASTARAEALAAHRHVRVQHHRAHIASVMAECGELDTPVIGVAFDGTGYGDDGTIWGGEFFAGSVRGGFERVAHLAPAALVGGDAAARFPVQAAAGFLAHLAEEIDFCAPPFSFPGVYRQAATLAAAGVRTSSATSAGRLFDTVAALTGFTRSATFEGQAALWLEHLARHATSADAFPLPYRDGTLDYRPALADIADARARGTPPGAIARAFHRGLARSIAFALADLADRHGIRTIALSGGVFQNALLLSDVVDAAAPHGFRVLINRHVPPNDGGISLGQAAMAAARDGVRA